MVVAVAAGSRVSRGRVAPVTVEVGPVANWSWWWVLSPFAAAVAWWAWADATGYTKRKAMEKMDQRKQDRINKHKEALGMKTRRPR